MGAAASALRHRGRLQLDAGSVKAPFSRQKSRKIATVTKAPAKKSPAARNVVTHLLIPYRRRRCAAGRNPTPHGRTCVVRPPTLRARPNNDSGTCSAVRHPLLHLFRGALYAYQTSSDALSGPSRSQIYLNGSPNEESMPCQTKLSGLISVFCSEMHTRSPSVRSIRRLWNCEQTKLWV